MIEPYALAQISRAKEIAVEMRKEMDDNGDGTINKEEFIHEVTNCLKAYADFNVC
jgi:Ca2+-binding EF-hand superfamily protein